MCVQPRVARKGAGKSGGFRTIIIFKVGKDTFFAHGFAKNVKATLSSKEFKALKRLANYLLELDAEAIEEACFAGELTEISRDDEGSEQD